MMDRRRMKNKGQSGFTIVELLVATAVFSGALLLIIVAFTQIGRLFYKGVTVSQTRQDASQIMNSITDDIRLSSGVGISSYCGSSCSGGGTTYTAYCIGNHIYIPNVPAATPLDLSQSNFVSKFGLIQAQLPTGACNGGSGPGGSYSFSDFTKMNMKPIELLGDDMRLADFQINQSTSTSYDIILTVAFGDNTVLNNIGTTLPDCKGISTGSQFCSVIQLKSTASFRPSLGL